ncbi:hypothetical protein NM688_g7542 [Phlebia brevispora]|uniref:Uncharacterized protein n=1 Tax=Phlebia brevispora TaxID=194682 RepID=A0ACC1S470_9APHY|nr:hypothetical protein NM688_g7542 [Phlebia brevispora]
MHSDTTLKQFEECTTALGASLRRFKTEVCEYSDTRELLKETAARTRAKAAATVRARSAAEAASTSVAQEQDSAHDSGHRLEQSRGQGQGSRRKLFESPAAGKGKEREVLDIASEGIAEGPACGDETSVAQKRQKEVGASQRKVFNLSTYKLHALGDYPTTIRAYSTTDNYSMQTGELEHRRVKRFYGHTNKHMFIQQIAKQQRREELIRRIHQRRWLHQRLTEEREAVQDGNQATQQCTTESLQNDSQRPTVPFTAQEPLPPTPPETHHHMMIPQLMYVSTCTPQVYVFDGTEPEFSDAERRSLVFRDNRIYMHKVLHVNYTTYDLRRAQDSLNPRTHADVMLTGHDDDCSEANPYWYARIIRIFHTEVHRAEDINAPFQKMEFLWVRWLGHDSTWHSGWHTRCLPRIGFVPEDDVDAFGFLDPQEVVRGVHLILAFAHGKTDELLSGPSIAQAHSDGDEDWQYFYVNIFVDRDMFMRFRGGGIGHRKSGVVLQALQNMPSAPVDMAETDVAAEQSAADEEMQELISSVHADVSLITALELSGPEDVDDDRDEMSGAVEEGVEGDEIDEGEEDFGYDDEESDDEPEDNAQHPIEDDELGAEDGEDDASPDDDLLAAEGFASY